MHGLINRAVQSFVCATYGRSCWLRVTEAARLGFVEFEAMLVYDDDMTVKVLEALSVPTSNRPRAEVFEDLGTYLVSSEHGRAAATSAALAVSAMSNFCTRSTIWPTGCGWPCLI